jgi:hypothetical protein
VSFEEFVEPVIQLVVTLGEVAILVVVVQQEILYLLRFRWAHGGTSLKEGTRRVD